MSFSDIVPDLKAKMPELRGRLLANQSLGEFTWFRVGGPAQSFYMPEDENDLAYFLRNLPSEISVTVIGAGSNLIVRDGGVARGADGQRSRVGVSERHSRNDRRRLAHEWRRIWWRNQGCSG